MRQRNRRLYLLHLLLFLLMCCLPVFVHAEVEWNPLSTLNLEKSPIDIFTTRDGRWAYILTPGEVRIYAVNTRELMGRVPVAKAISRISASSNGDRLYLINEKAKTLSILSVAFTRTFSVTDCPYKGPANAPVVIAVFSDYQ